MSALGVLRLRAVNPSLCDRSATRFAQDDGFARGKAHLVGCAKSTKDRKKSQALRMTFLWELKKEIPSQLALMGLRPVSFDPCTSHGTPGQVGRTGGQGSRLRCLLKVGWNYSKSYVGRHITGRM